MKEVIYRGFGACLNDGHLCGYSSIPGGIYLTNGGRKAIDTNVSLSVPAGLTVQIRGIREHRLRGLHVVDEDIVGPKDAEDIQVLLHNGADATIVLPSGEPIASARIVETPARLRFRSAVPPGSQPSGQTEGKRPLAAAVEKELNDILS